MVNGMAVSLPRDDCGAVVVPIRALQGLQRAVGGVFNVVSVLPVPADL